MSQVHASGRLIMRITLTFAVMLYGEGVIAAQAVENPNQPVPDAEYLWWQLPPSEQQYERIDGCRVKSHVEEITARPSHAVVETTGFSTRASSRGSRIMIR